MGVEDSATAPSLFTSFLVVVFFAFGGSSELTRGDYLGIDIADDTYPSAVDIDIKRTRARKVPGSSWPRYLPGIPAVETRLIICSKVLNSAPFSCCIDVYIRSFTLSKLFHCTISPVYNTLWFENHLSFFSVTRYSKGVNSIIPFSHFICKLSPSLCIF